MAQIEGTSRKSCIHFGVVAIKPGRSRGSIEDVAREAQVSRSTASRVLRGLQKVLPETQDKILAAAQKVNYRPNLMARALRTGEVNTVALVLNAAQIALPLYAEAVAALKDDLEAHRLNLMIPVPGPNDNPAHIIEELSGWCSVIAIPGGSPEVNSAIRSTGIPVVLLDWIGPDKAPPQQASIPGEIATAGSIGFDQAGAVRQAVNHLVALGHRNIAYVGGPRERQDYAQREIGFREGMQQALLSVRPEWMFLCDPENAGDTASATHAFEQAISGARCRLSGLVCATDALALEIIAAIRRHGRQVPDDFSVIGYGNTFATRLSIPQLTTIHHDGRELGNALARMVVAYYEGTVQPAESVVLPAQFILRDSTAPRRSHIILSGGVPSPGVTIFQEPTSPLMPGIYELEARHSGMMLDVPNAARTPGCHVWQWPRNGTSAQLWHISHAQDEWYRIRNVGSWLYMDADASMPGGCPVVTNPMNERNPDMQLWKFESMEPGSSTYRITSKAKGLVVDFAYGSLVSNELVILFPWNGNTCQQWTALRVPFLTDEYEIVALHSSRALDVPGQSRVVGTVPCQSDRSRSLGQRWRLIYRGGGNYQVQSMLSNLMLQASITPAPGVMLTQDDPEAGDAQLWRIEPVDEAQQSYRLVGKATDMVLQIHAGQHSAGMQLEMGAWTGALHQQWLIYSDND